MADATEDMPEDPLADDLMEEVIAAAYDRLPSETQLVQKASAPTAPQYIRQLQLVKTTIDIRVEAIRHFVAAENVRQHWAQSDISETKIGLYQRRLLSAHTQARDFVLAHDSGEAEEEQGNSIFHKTINRIGHVKLNGHEMAPEVSAGELHHFSNGECRIFGTKEEHPIGWHPRWEELI